MPSVTGCAVIVIGTSTEVTPNGDPVRRFVAQTQCTEKDVAVNLVKLQNEERGRNTGREI